MKLGNHEIRVDRCFCIAEIGINHAGSIDTALAMIEAAAIAGADAVKFQKRTIELNYTESELDTPRESPFGDTNRDLKYGLEFHAAEYDRIAACAEQNDIAWFASAWDRPSAEFLVRHGAAAIKVPSARLADKATVWAAAKSGLPVILSCGMSEEHEIRAATRAVYSYHEAGTERPGLALMHCVSAYPCPVEHLNLLRIQQLAMLFPGVPVGYSGHEVGLWSTLAAVALGAQIIERHVTLDRSSWGSDQSASIEFHGFARLVAEIRDFERARGSHELGILDCERESIAKLKRSTE